MLRPDPTSPRHQRRIRTFTLALLLAGCAPSPLAPRTNVSPDPAQLDPSEPGSAALVTVGFQHSCLLTTGGDAYCWGMGRDGQLGSANAPDSSLVPLPVGGDLRFRALAGGVNFTCGIADNGEAYCWGSNAEGQLGNGSTVASRVPTRVSGDVAFRFVAAGRKYNGGNSSACAITASGTAYCWGAGFGSTPVLLGGGHLWTTIAMAGTPCGVTTTGETYCWEDAGNPVLVPGVAFVSVSTSRANTCAIDAAGAAFCWGINDAGQVGSGPEDAELTLIAAPRAVAGGYAFRSVTSADRSTCGIGVDLSLLCWGTGYGPDQAVARSPTPFAAGLTFSNLEMSAFHQCGVSAEQEVYCWGANAKGQLGDGTTIARMEPAPVAAPPATVARAGT